MEDERFQEFRERSYRYLWEEIEPRAEEWDRTGEIPLDALWPELRERGFLRLLIPEEYGGLDLSIQQYVQFEKEWAKVSGGLRVILHVHNLGAEVIDRMGSEEQRDRYLTEMVEDGTSAAFALTEPHAGSGRDIETRAERRGDRYVINGRKHHITNANFADYFNLICQTENGVSNILVPRDAEGFTIHDMPETMGSHGSFHGYLTFEDCAVPEENLLGREGDALEGTIEGLRVSRIFIAANALGIAERCLESSLDWTKKRVTFDKPLAERQLIQQYLTEMGKDVYTLRLAVRDAARQVDETGRPGVEADLCKLLAIEANRRVTDNALLVHGGLGYYREFPILRMYNDARLNWLEEGTPSIHNITAARGMLRGDLPYEREPYSSRYYNLDEYDPNSPEEYTLSYE